MKMQIYSRVMEIHTPNAMHHEQDMENFSSRVDSRWDEPKKATEIK